MMETKEVVLTEREKDVVKFIKEYKEDYGYSPTFREIADGLYLSSVYSIQCHVSHLIEKGAITMTPRKCRSLMINE